MPKSAKKRSPKSAAVRATKPPQPAKTDPGDRGDEFRGSTQQITAIQGELFRAGPVLLMRLAASAARDVG
jgi:hypothetical protein